MRLVELVCALPRAVPGRSASEDFIASADLNGQSPHGLAIASSMLHLAEERGAARGALSHWSVAPQSRRTLGRFRRRKDNDQFHSKPLSDPHQGLEGYVLLATLDARVVRRMHADLVGKLRARDSAGAPRSSNVLAQLCEPRKRPSFQLIDHRGQQTA